MKIGIPKEIFDRETRVAVIPPMIPLLTKLKHEVFIEKGAGVGASFLDDEYVKFGATIIDDSKKLYHSADVLLKINPPQMHPKTKTHEVELLREATAIIGFLMPLDNPEAIGKMVQRRITGFAMDYIPRISRAQSMDALSSCATVAGYKSVLIAADHLGKFFPLLMTAAGTIPPASVLVLGAGVAGLQAIATARRLGAKVEAFDPRPATKEQVLSLGAQFVEMELPEDAETASGYAKQQPEQFLKKEREIIASHLLKVDVVITTAQVFGKRAPILITEEMVKMMKPGTVIVDLAGRHGGNCELSLANQEVVKYDVTIIGAWNLCSLVPIHASQMYSKNIINLFQHLFQRPDNTLNFEDEITKGACITYNGEIVNEEIRNALS